MAEPSKDVAGVVAPPPLIFGAAVAAGLALQRVRPVPLPNPLGKAFGAALGAAGIALGVSAVATLRRAGTNVDPYQETSAIVADGPYAFTRNPIYLGMGLLAAGIGALANAGWVVALVPVAATVVQKGVIEREEAYLARRFPEAYPPYRNRVRRWV